MKGHPEKMDKVKCGKNVKTIQNSRMTESNLQDYYEELRKQSPADMINTICLLAERSQAKQTVTPAPASSAVSTPQSRYSPVSSQAWQENGISRPESVVSLENRNI